jgi:alpha/beta superfamily hydrolase
VTIDILSGAKWRFLRRWEEVDPAMTIGTKPLDGLRTRNVTFQGAGDGPTLRGVLHLPKESPKPFPAAVVCHPHTLMGGNMDNGLVVRVCLALGAAGWAALRFDFRGAGGSAGSFDEGQGERDDVKGAVDFLLAQSEIDPDQLAVIGYSFGAGVALHHAARDPRLRRMVGIALVRHHYEDPFLDEDPRPKLFIAGGNDPWAPAEALRLYVERLRSPKRLHVVRGADHLFSGHVSNVTGVVVDWLTY